MSEEKRTKQLKIVKLVWKIVLLLWIILVILLTSAHIAAIWGTSGDSSQEQTEFNTQQQTEFNIGDVIAYEGKEITIKSVERNWSRAYSKPDAGKEYVKITVLIENKSDDKVSYSSFDWKVQDSDGDIKENSFVSYEDDDALRSGEIAAGGHKSGSIVFEVPKDDNGLVLQYEPSFWSKKSIDIKL